MEARPGAAQEDPGGPGQGGADRGTQGLSTTLLPTPSPAEALDWVGEHLPGLWSGPLAASPRFRGGATAAHAALGNFDVAGYARGRSEVWPEDRRRASALSPYIRHGLLRLASVWESVGGGPAEDVRRFRDELLWQEYARHLYARLGGSTAVALRAERTSVPVEDPWPASMACMAQTVGELERDGWLVNQTRMWLASQWSVRHGGRWQDGEALMFTHLLDGSRAANRLGWQWAAGTATGRPYGFSRWQVEKRAPGLCARCPLSNRCPIQDWPVADEPENVTPDPRLRHDPDVGATAGPEAAVVEGDAEAVWLTAESLGDDDPALLAHPDLPAVFVFDRDLLHRLGLTAKRLVFLAEALADLGGRRALEIHLGVPAQVLAGRRLAATFTPVPGWRRHRRQLEVVAVHPWPWLRRPTSGPVTSWSAWQGSSRKRRT